MVTPSSPIYRRLWAYLEERFPPVVYAVLVGLFFGSAVLVARAWEASAPVPPLSWLGAVVVLLAFLHLRLMDEAKDFEQDRAAYPDRVLSRGIVTLPLLQRVLMVVVLLEVILACLLGPASTAWWCGAFVYSLLMRFEFGVGAWLSRHIVLYAITHNPVVALLALFAHSATKVTWDARYLWYVVMVSLGSLAFEIGRKTRLSSEEILGVESYSSALGRARAGTLLRVVVLLASIAGQGTILEVGGASAMTWVGSGLLWVGALVACWAAGPSQPSKRVDGASSAFLLVSFIAVGLAAW